MDKQTLSNYGWIVISILIIAVMLAFASPFGSFIGTAVKNTAAGLVDVSNNANLFLNSMSVKTYTPEEVVELFKSIEPLETVQTKRNEFSDATSWNEYVNGNFNMQKEATNAYNSLTDEQKQIVIDELGQENIDKLMKTELETKFNKVAFTVSKGTEDYQFQAAFASNRAYEIGTHISYGESGGHPMTVVVIDTNKITGSWTPSGEYELGKSEYDVLYCCEADKPVKNKTFYKKMNIEDADYFNEDQAAMIRAIVKNSYPYISLEQMKSNLASAGYPNVDKLTRGDIITAVQFAIWRYSNATYKHADGIDKYGETTNNNLSYARPYHDYSNELWHWWPSAKNATYYNAEEEVKINALVDYLCTRTPIYATDENRVVTDIDVIASNATQKADGTYDIALTLELNGKIESGDNVVIKAKNGSEELSAINAVAGQNQYTMNLNVEDLSDINIVASGTQDLGLDAYLYMPREGKEVSQVLVGMSNGETNIKATTNIAMNN